MYELIITEKPNAAKKIAEALADGKPLKKSLNGAPYYEVTHSGKDLVVGCAVGHLFGLRQKDKKAKLPIFDIEWAPTYEITKSGAFSKKYAAALKKVAKDATSFTVATDYDVEGEVIGLNVVRFICRKNDARRMKFSTLTKDELVQAYEHCQKTLDWGQANAGETRHILDWYYGINVSRALTKAISSTGHFKLMSTGRVQGPALKLIVEKEKEIQAFKPEPYWMVSLSGAVKAGSFEAWHEKERIWDEKEADRIFQKVRGEKSASVKDVETSKFTQAPPYPFDLTSLQIEAHKCVGISPKATLEIAQDLYTGGYISYPRTSSQQLPEAIGYRKIISDLSKSKNFKANAEFLLARKQLKPNNGKKVDPAHPAIYPTGIVPKLDDRKIKIYDLIVKRFMATFGDDAVRQTVKALIDVKSEIFIAKGTTTIEKGWHTLYSPYVMLKEEELPAMAKGEAVKVSDVAKHDKETTPPKRYTESSIIKELEKRNLGTKATRAQIVDTLFQRGYVDGKAIQATEIGIRTSDTLSKHCQLLVDEAMTRHFEEEMDMIRDKTKTPDNVLDEARKVVTEIVDEFRKDEKAIGEELYAANRETVNVMTQVGKCPICHDGILAIRKGRFGHFIACGKYPECKTIFSIPQGLVKPTGEVCSFCGYPKVKIIKKRKGPQDVCINPKCPGKMKGYTSEQMKEMDDIGTGKTEKPCPKCKVGKLVLRKSIYGAFIGCNQYPKCRYTQKIEKQEE